jgi:hypothetical protein
LVAHGLLFHIPGRDYPDQVSLISLYRDERSTIFASVYDCILIFYFDFLEIPTPHAVSLLALRATAAPQLLFVNGEVAVTAADLFWPFFHEDEVFMSA